MPQAAHLPGEVSAATSERAKVSGLQQFHLNSRSASSLSSSACTGSPLRCLSEASIADRFRARAGRSLRPTGATSAPARAKAAERPHARATVHRWPSPSGPAGKGQNVARIYHRPIQILVRIHSGSRILSRANGILNQSVTSRRIRMVAGAIHSQHPANRPALPHSTPRHSPWEPWEILSGNSPRLSTIEPDLPQHAACRGDVAKLRVHRSPNGLSQARFSSD